MRSPIDSNSRRVRSQYGSISQNHSSRQQSQAKSGWLATLGRALRDNAALIAALVALIGVLITQVVTTNNTREQLTAQRELEESRAQSQQQLEEGRAREAELQTYLDEMGALLLDKDSPLPEAEPGGPMSSLARAKTLTMLERLDGQRKRIVLQFLYESQLSQKEEPIINLAGANLSDANLKEAFLEEAGLRNANLEEAHLEEAHLRNAYLCNAHLRGARLSYAYLRDACLEGAELDQADLQKADLQKSKMDKAKLQEADLQGAKLQGANLQEADFQEANLQGAKLQGANLQGSKLQKANLRGVNLKEVQGLTQAQLEQAIGDKETRLSRDLKRPSSWE